MVAHLDAVTSLAVDPNGLYLLSGSEYKWLFLCNVLAQFYFFHKFVKFCKKVKRTEICTVLKDLVVFLKFVLDFDAQFGLVYVLLTYNMYS